MTQEYRTLRVARSDEGVLRGLQTRGPLELNLGDRLAAL